MVRLDDFGEASRLAFQCIKPGVLTNHVMTADEYREDIESGTFYAHTWPGGVLFLRDRGGYNLLSYYIIDTNVVPDCELPDDTVTEIAYKPSGAEAAERAIRFWEITGLNIAFERIRLTRLETADKSGIGNAAVGIPFQCRGLLLPGFALNIAIFQDLDDCQKLMQANFDPITGHIPTSNEIETSIAEGCILCLKDSFGKICGLLRCVQRAASVEIRQLALREDVRGQGLARQLLDIFIEKWGSGKSTVWMRDGNVPALKAYNSAGFTADGWRSAVMRKPHNPKAESLSSN